MTERAKPGPKPTVTDEEILKIFRATSDPVLSTAEIAEELPIGRRSVLARLKSLREEGVVEGKQIGGRNTVWWVTEKEGGVGT